MQVIEQLLAALRPFDALLQPHLGADPARPVFGINDATVTVGDLLRIRAALSAGRKALAEPQAQGVQTEPAVAIVTTSHDYGATIDWRLNPLPTGTELYAAPQPAQTQGVPEAILFAANALLRRHLDDAEVHPCDHHSDKARAAQCWPEVQSLFAALAAAPQPAQTAVQAASDNWQGEEWERLAWHLCAEENGEEACNELIWEGGPVPQPWGDRWMKYEPEAKRMIDLVRRFTAPPTQRQEPAQADHFPDAGKMVPTQRQDAGGDARQPSESTLASKAEGVAAFLESTLRTNSRDVSDWYGDADIAAKTLRSAVDAARALGDGGAS